MISRVYRFRWVAAALVLFALGITALSLTTLQSGLSDIRTSERSRSAWIVSQLEFEFIRFQRALAGYQAGLIPAEDVALRFDILWSRADLLATGTTADRLAKLGVDIEMLGTIQNRLEEADKTAMNLQDASPLDVQKVQTSFGQLEAGIHRFSLAVAEAASREGAANRARLLRMSRITMILSICAVLALVMLALVFFLDSRSQRKLYQENVDLLTKSRAAAQAKAQFLSVINHELRTPLTSILGSIGLLRGGVAGQLETPVQKLLDIAHINCGRLADLVNDLLDLDKLASGNAKIEKDSLDLSGLVLGEIEANANYAVHRDVSLVPFSIEPGIKILGDKTRLVQVLANLLSNAAKYSSIGGEVHVKLCKVGNRARLTVQDFGLGIPAQYQNAVFERFRQVDSSDHRSRGGIGLGLSIAKEIVESHGGTIAVQSREGAGSTFTVYLELAKTQSEKGDAQVANPADVELAKPVAAA